MSDAVIKTRISTGLPHGRVSGETIKTSLFVSGTALVFGVATVTMLHIIALIPTAPVAPAPVESWIDIKKPVHIYSLEAPELRALPIDYSARRHSLGGGREDVLTIGALADDQPSLRLRLFRRSTEARSSVPLYSAIAHQAAESGLGIDRSSLPDLLPTRFGKVEVSDIVLSGHGAPASCSGFRLALDTPAFSMTGIACAGRSQPMTRAGLGCLIDRLDLASAREDQPMIDFFAATELKRNPACEGMRLGPDQLHAAWLDDKPATARKSLRRR